MVSRREWLIALAVALAALTLAQIPYILGYACARPGMEFTGIIMNPEDAQSYFAKMRVGYDGAWLYTIPFTTEEHAPAFVGGFYLTLGHLARVFNLSLDAMWHTARITADLILFLVTFGFIAYFSSDTRVRWTAYLLAIFGSGLGWVLFLLNQPYWLDTFPVDFKMPEAHLFFTALTFPHVAFGTALILASVWMSARIMARRGWRLAIGAGALNLALAIVYPFLIYLVAAITGIYWLMCAARARRVLWREGFLFALSFAIHLPILLYYANTLATNPIFRVWDAQAITLSPPLPHYLIAFGVFLLLALFAPRTSGSDLTLVWAWVIAAALLVYAPLNPQRRFVQGVQIPLAILAAVGFVDVVMPRLAQTRAFQTLAKRPNYSDAGLERLLIVLLLLFASLSNLYVLASASITAALQQPYPLFRPRGESAAIEWLRATTARSQVVLGVYESGNYIAARAGNRVVVGHWAETVDFQEKFDATEKFFNAVDDAWRRDLLARYRVEYVWFGELEHKSGKFDPAYANDLIQVYANSDLAIFRVRR